MALRQRPDWKGACAVAALILSALALWKYRILDTATKPYQLLSSNCDVYTQIYPMALRAAAWLGAGQVPLWNPFQYCGHPFLATGIYGVLYPFNFPYLVFPTHVAIEIVAVMHLATAGTFTYAFARTIGLGFLSSCMSATVFMFSGFVVLQALWFPPAMCAATWLPLALLAIERIVRTRSIAWSIVFGAAVALSFLAGWPQTWLYSIYAIAAYTFMRLVVAFRTPEERPHLSTMILVLGFGTTIAVGLMMGQLLPGFELQALGPRRAGGISAEQMLVYGGPVGPSWLMSQLVDATPGSPRFPHVGIVTLMLLPLSLFVSTLRPWLWCFWGLLALSLGASASSHSPVLDLYRALPGASLFRAPLRFLFLHAFAAAILSGVGLEALTSGRVAVTRPVRSAMAVVIATFALLIIAIIEIPLRSQIFLALGTALAYAALWSSRSVARFAPSAALLALVWWNLFTSIQNDFMHPFQDLATIDGERRIFDQIKREQRFDRTYIHSQLEQAPRMSKTGTLREIYTITDYEPLSLLRYDRFFRLLESPKDHRNPLHTFTGELRADPELATFGLLDLMSVRFIVAPKFDSQFRAALENRGSKWRLVSKPSASQWSVLYENTDVLARAFVAHDIRHVTDGDEALAAIASPEFDPRRTVVLEGASDVDRSASPALPIEPAQLVRYEPGAVTVQTTATTPGYLVLTDTFYPGWIATVDGAPVPIARANYLFRAVPVAAGQHTVTFEYAPRSFAVGIGITIATLLAIVGTLVALAWRSRRRRPIQAIRAKTRTVASSPPTT